MRPVRLTIAAAAALLAFEGAAHAADPPPADDDFLEFLGSTDSDDPEFNAYMASGDADEALERVKDKDQDSTQTPPAADKPAAGKVKSDAT